MDSFSVPLDKRADPSIFEVLLDLVALFGFDFVVLVDVEVVGVRVGGGGKHNLADILEPFGVKGGELAASADYVAVLVQLEVQYCGMKVIQTRVKPPSDNLAGGAAAEVAEFRRVLIDADVIRDDRAAIPQTAQHLGRVKTDSGRSSKGPCTLAFVARP